MEKSDTPAFSLIELLAVIFIVSLLMAVLLPILSAVRSQARIVVCASNLHQNFIACDSYAKANDDRWPGTDFGSHTNQFYSINSPYTNGPLYYLWKAGFVSDLRSWYCPAGKESLKLSWRQNSNGQYQPKISTHGSGYQFRMRLAFYEPQGRGANYNIASYADKTRWIVPENFRRLSLFTDAFGYENNRLKNHPRNKWNVLFSDSSVKTRCDKEDLFDKLDLSWYQAGDWLLPLPNRLPDRLHHVAFIWHFFDRGRWRLGGKVPTLIK